jgi:hypothetical protein
MTTSLAKIRVELTRLGATKIYASLDDAFEPEAGELVLVESQDAYWHLLPDHFLTLLRELPDGAGADEVHKAIETHAPTVWHGPAPTDSRDAANGT